MEELHQVRVHDGARWRTCRRVPRDHWRCAQRACRSLPQQVDCLLSWSDDDKAHLKGGWRRQRDGAALLGGLPQRALLVLLGFAKRGREHAAPCAACLAHGGRWIITVLLTRCLCLCVPGALCFGAGTAIEDLQGGAAVDSAFTKEFLPQARARGEGGDSWRRAGRAASKGGTSHACAHS